MFPPFKKTEKLFEKLPYATKDIEIAKNPQKYAFENISI
jgi:hypothetical protein